MILIVDDHLDTASALVRMLKKCGHDPLAVESAAAAMQLLDSLASAQSPPPELIILDMMLPDMDGLELLRRLRDKPELRDLPVIGFSGDYSHERMRQARDLGVKQFLVKGTVSWQVLCDAVDRFVPRPDSPPPEATDTPKP